MAQVSARHWLNFVDPALECIDRRAEHGMDLTGEFLPLELHGQDFLKGTFSIPTLKY